MRESLRTILDIPRYLKRTIALLFDISICLLTVYTAFYLCNSDFTVSVNHLLASIIAVGFALPVFIISGLYRAIFRYSGWPALFEIVRAIAVYSFLYLSLITLVGVQDIPRAVGIIQPFLLSICIMFSRGLVRYCLSDEYQKILKNKRFPKALVYGAGSAGRQLVSAMYNSKEMQIVGYIDDDSSLHGYVLNGLKIFSSNELEKVIKAKNVSHILLAIPSATRRRRNEILKFITKYQVSVRTLPSLTDIAQGKVNISDIRDLDIDDLLCREVVSPNQILLSKNISDKVVLVTGAGGSIGSEICRQIIKLVPQKLLLVEVSEYSLYKIHSELLSILNKIDDKDFNKVVPLLASVQDKNRINEILTAWRPDTIYHAAAYKHVPIVEHNLGEGIKNNVFGTLNIAESAIESCVSNFVLVSTDKAVRPTNVMGATKRLAEMCLQSLNDLNANKAFRTNFSMVRFGNVLGSSGSVIPLFREQIRNGGPITLTHHDITRYFMTIPEAAELVIQASAMGKDGDVFVLDMGEPVKIIDLAKRMIDLSGLTLCSPTNPDGDIEIKITGLRPGEKLYEELLLGDDPQETTHPKIKRAQDPFINWEDLGSEINNLKTLLENNDLESVLILLKKLVVGYKPNTVLVDWVFNEQTQLRKETSEY